MPDARRGRLLVGLCVLCLWFGPASDGADAAAPVATGWWTSLQAGPLGQGAGPDVPDDGLLVQAGAGPDDPVAYAALRYQVPSGQAPSTLTLRIAPGSLSTSDPLRVCALVDATFDAAFGAPIEAAPAFDERACIDVVQVDGTYSVAVDGLAPSGGGQLGVALVPGEVGRAVLAAPGADSLQTAAAVVGSAGGASEVPAPGGEGTPGFALPPAGASGPFGDLPPLPSSGFSDGSLPAPAASTAQEPVTTETGAAAPEGSTEGVAGDPGAPSDESDLAPFAFIAVVLAGGGSWWLAGRSAAGDELFVDDAADDVGRGQSPTMIDAGL